MTISSELYRNISLFQRSAEIHDYKLDERQSVQLGVVLGIKLVTFAESAGLTHSFSRELFAIYGGVALGVIATIWKSVPEHERVELAKNSKAWKWLNFSGGALYDALQHGDQVINGLLAVYYIAQIALFGFQVGPTLGLITLSLVFIKQLGYLPERIDRPLQFVFPWIDIKYTLYSNRSLLLKLIAILVNLTDITSNPALRWGEAPDYLTGEHRFNPLESVPDLRSGLKVNKGYVYSHLLSSLMPPLDRVDQPREEAKKLCRQIDEKNPPFTNAQKDGWEALKRGLCNGRFEGKPPHNIEYFNQIMHSVLKNTLADKEFNRIVCELAEVGNHCVANWTSEIYLFYNPNSEEIAWSVHNELAKWRGHVLEESIREVFRSGISSVASGGFNNVHLVEAFHTLERHRIRTYQSEISHKLNSPSLLSCLIWKCILNSNDQQSGPGELLRMTFSSGLLPSIMVLAADEIQKICTLAEFKIFNFPEKHVAQIYRAIKPAEPECEDIRAIPWQSVLTWIGQFTTRLELDEGEFYKRYTKKTNYDQDYLTEEGVELLLLDLGICQLVS